MHYVTFKGFSSNNGINFRVSQQRKYLIFLVQTQLTFSGIFIRSVTRITTISQNGPDMKIEINLHR